MDFCQIYKYLHQFLFGETLLFLFIHFRTRSLIKISNTMPFSTCLLVLQGLCGRLENVFEIVSGRYTVTIVANTLLPGSPQ